MFFHPRRIPRTRHLRSERFDIAQAVRVRGLSHAAELAGSDVLCGFSTGVRSKNSAVVIDL